MTYDATLISTKSTALHHRLFTRATPARHSECLVDELIYDATDDTYEH